VGGLSRLHAGRDAPAQGGEITLRQLRALVAVADAGGFRRAAERLGVAQPSLSAQIQGLEAALGRRLVERRGRGAALTPDGREAERRARDILASVGDMRAALSAGVGALKLGVTPTLGPYLLPQVMAALNARGSALRLAIREEGQSSLARGLSEGAHDAVLTQLPVTGRDLEGEELFRERLLLVVPRDHPLARLDAAPPEALEGLDILSMGPEHRLHEQVAGLCETYGARFRHDYHGASLDALRLMVGAGVGATFLPELYLRSEAANDPSVAALPLRGRSVIRAIGLVRRRSTGRTEELADLSAILKQACAARLRGMDRRAA
jgi:LysR family hydrogen peroxide-inducible transcriptional activator